MWMRNVAGVRKGLLVGVGVAVAVALSGCGGGGTPATSPTPSTSPTATSSPTTSPVPSPTATRTESASPTATSTDCTPFGSTGASTSEDPLALSSLTGASMRVGRHDCFERFVFEMAGSGPDPGWRVRYQDPITGQGSGEPIELLGAAQIEILIGAMTVNEFEGRPEEWPAFEGPDDIVTSGFIALREARNLYGYEGTTQLGLGVDRVRPFRAFWLADPPRLVVDVSTAGAGG
jgi:hypothetical protein